MRETIHVALFLLLLLLANVVKAQETTHTDLNSVDVTLANAIGNSTGNEGTLVPLTETMESKKAITANVLLYDVNLVICYGQSLSVNPEATNPNKDSYRNTLSFVGGTSEYASGLDINNASAVTSFYGTQLVSLSTIKGNWNFSNFPAVTASAVAWLQLLEDENKLDMTNYSKKLLLSTPGYHGIHISSMEKGTNYYDRLMLSVKKGNELSKAAGKTFGVPCILWVQGEADQGNTFDYYYKTLENLYNDLNADIKTITGQQEDVKLITYQTAPQFNTTYNVGSASLAQFQLAKDNPNIYLGGAMYQYQYTDDVHPIDNAVTGIQLGIAAKRIISDGSELKPFAPASSSFSKQVDNSYELRIVYNVPVEPMRFDISGDKFHNVNGKQVNFGFKLENASGTNIILSEPTIELGNTLVIKCSEDPSKATLSYAVDGKFGGGNLCDAQNINIKIKGNEYVIDNFAPSFKNMDVSKLDQTGVVVVSNKQLEEKYQVKIYPNPTNNIIHIDFEQSGLKPYFVALSAINGAVIKKIKVNDYNSTSLNIDVISIPPGIYNILLYSKNDSIVIKSIIIN